MTSTAVSHSLGWAEVDRAPAVAAPEPRREEAARAEADAGLTVVRFRAGTSPALASLGILLVSALLWAWLLAATL